MPILLNSKEIKNLYPMSEAVTVVEQAFSDYAAGNSRMPPKLYLDLPEFNGDFRAMPAYCAAPGIAGVKWVNSHPDNIKTGLPAVMGLIVLNDPKTAQPVGILDGTSITALRTGAAGGVAVKHLAASDAAVCAFIGAGAQAIYQLQAILTVRAIREVRVSDLSKTALQSFTTEAKNFFSGRIIESPNIESCVHNAQIVTTTTPCREPIVRSEWIAPGTHINAIGADAEGKQELESALLKRAVIVVDDLEQAAHSGECNVPLAEKAITKSDIRASIGEIIAGRKPGRSGDEQITVFDSTGLAIQDIASAAFILQKAEKQNIGTVYSFTS